MHCVDVASGNRCAFVLGVDEREFTWRLVDQQPGDNATVSREHRVTQEFLAALSAGIDETGEQEVLILAIGFSEVRPNLLAFTVQPVTDRTGLREQLTPLGKITGPGFDEDGIVDAVERATDVYLARRREGERFLDTYRRVGIDAFKEAIYG